ncbi:hypothetical protein DFH06DRAFT_81224 [Mycena polygramma]|nr:hypothetical protein DFH06DRAFT_81224 [Mycena polygramma]
MRVCKQYEPGARMVMDSILLSVAEICDDSNRQEADGRAVAIYPELRLGTGDGVLIRNPETGYELALTGNVDYGGVSTPEEDLKDLLASEAELANELQNLPIILVEGKRPGDILSDSLPEAIAQAIAYCEATGCVFPPCFTLLSPSMLNSVRRKTVRFSLTDGKKWIFCLLSVDAEGRRICYNGPVTTILEPRFDNTDGDAAWERSVHQVTELVFHWLLSTIDPLSDPLYTLA